MSVNNISKIIHKENVELGWYTNLDTGEYQRKTNDQFFALMHTELSEAYEAYRKDLMDDHLPQYHGTIVETADYYVRLLDFIGCIDFGSVVSQHNKDTYETYYGIQDLNFSKFINRLHKLTCEMLESLEFGYPDEFSRLAYEAIFLGKYYFKKYENIDILDIALEKHAYNKTRQDHKLENRKADGGKKI